MLINKVFHNQLSINTIYNIVQCTYLNSNSFCIPESFNTHFTPAFLCTQKPL